MSKSKKAPTSEKKSHKQTKTRRQRVQEKDLLINLLEVIPDSIYFKDIESRFIIGSKYLVKDKLGMDTMDEIIGKTDFDFFSEEHARQAFEDEQKIIHSGEPIIGTGILPNVKKQKYNCSGIKNTWKRPNRKRTTSCKMLKKVFSC
ncbi:MAG: hypothetical protein P8Y60_19200 [Calditrichota bacterium]